MANPMGARYQVVRGGPARYSSTPAEVAARQPIRVASQALWGRGSGVLSSDGVSGLDVTAGATTRSAYVDGVWQELQRQWFARQLAHLGSQRPATSCQLGAGPGKGLSPPLVCSACRYNARYRR